MQTSLKHLDEFDIHPLWCEFRNTKVETDFLLHHSARGQSQLRTALILCSIFFVIFSLTDVAVLGYSRESLILFMARVLVAVTAGAAIYLIYRKPLSIAIPMWAATVVEIVGMGAFMLIVFFRAGESPWHAMSLSTMLIVIYLFIPNRLILALGVALASTVTFILITLNAGSLEPAILFNISMILLLTNTVGGVAAHRYHRLWRDEFRAQSLLKRLSERDHLTGCYNRRYLDHQILEKEIVRAQRQGLWLTVILCDLDHFKSVNDTYGHQAGDAVLSTFASLLHQLTREHVDYVVRYGGEEFLLVLPGTDLTGGALLAERLRATFAETCIYPATDQEIRMTASFGVTGVKFSAEGKEISGLALIAAADTLLYDAKNAGRNHVKSVEL